MTEQEGLEFTIENVGGIERATLVLKPGVNCLRGVNGSGKTSAMKAIKRAQGGGGELERRDGSARGTVTGPGVTLKVGKVVRTTGEAELSLADTYPLSMLIDPGLKDSDAAARARVRALVELLQIGVSDETLGILTAGDHDAAKWMLEAVRSESIDDLLDANERLRGHLHSRARSHETEAAEATGRAKAAKERREATLADLGGPEKLVDMIVDDALAAVSEGGRNYERAEALCGARAKLEKQQEDLRETLGERPDETPAKKEANRTALKAAELKVEIEELEKRAAALEAERKGLIEASKAAAGQQEELRQFAERWDEAQEILAKTPEGPTREELTGLKVQHIDQPKEHLEMARKSDAVRTAEIDRMQAQQQAEAAEAEAKRLRDLAGDLPNRLGEILAVAGAKDITVVDGRIQALVDGNPVDWEKRLSDGQRISRTLDIFVRTQGEDVVAPIDDEFWMRLDPEARRQFAAIALKKGIFVLTEEPADGELRVEQA